MCVIKPRQKSNRAVLQGQDEALSNSAKTEAEAGCKMATDTRCERLPCVTSPYSSPPGLWRIIGTPSGMGSVLHPSYLPGWEN
jgi:hypothetical protein